MLKLLVVLLTSLMLLSSVGCVNPPMYYWGNYEHRLYKSYSHPETTPKFHAELLRILETSKRRGIKPPPGIAAEYGFSQYKEGNAAKAIEYLQFEMETWPESVEMLTVVVENIMAMGNEENEAKSDETADPPTDDGNDAAEGMPGS